MIESVFGHENKTRAIDRGQLNGDPPFPTVTARGGIVKPDNEIDTQ